MRYAFLLLAVVACGGGVESESAIPGAKDAPSPAPAADATKVASYGTELKVATGQLGGVVPKPGKCSQSTRSYTVSLVSGVYHADLCDESNDPHVVERTLTSDELASVKTTLDTYTETSLPDDCSYDGTAYSLTVGAKLFYDYDYNCNHRTDIGYVKQGIQTMERLLESLAK